jgi:hypothetical protein
MSFLSDKEIEDLTTAVDDRTKPAGTYLCHVSVVQPWTAESSGKKSLLWKFKVAPDEKFAGHEFWSWTGMEENSLQFTKRRFTELGLAFSANEEEIVGTPCQVFVEIGTDQKGEPSNNVKKAVRYTGEIADYVKPPEADEDLDAAFGSDDEGLI